jgi:hypothetical protein
MITVERLAEIESAPREASICKAEAKELANAYRRGQQCEPVAKVIIEGGADYDVKLVDLVDLPVGEHLLYTSAPTIPEGWTQREIELFDGMIEVQEKHAARCEPIQNKVMALKQKSWDLERVALLKKCKSMLSAAPKEGVKS